MLQQNNSINLGSFALQKEIKTPEHSTELAELFGIMLGDGGITDRQIKITLDSETDKSYSLFVSDLLKELFAVTPTIRLNKDSRSMNIVISRTALVSFFEKNGLQRGNKITHQVDIPTWVMENNTYSQACMRGLMDTDGSIFMERHTIKDRLYSYPRVWFVSRSMPLLNSVSGILAEAGFSPKVRGEKAVTLEKRDDVLGYFSSIGTHNQKHQDRFVDFMEECVSGRNERS